MISKRNSRFIYVTQLEKVKSFKIPDDMALPSKYRSPRSPFNRYELKICLGIIVVIVLINSGRQMYQESIFDYIVMLQSYRHNEYCAEKES
jgi:hypothetical protein